METPDFRALCADLLRESEKLVPPAGECGPFSMSVETLAPYDAAAKRVRAALEAVPVAPAPDEEILRTYGLAKRDHCYEGELDDWPKKAERAATVAGLRAVLARYGSGQRA